MTRWIFAIAASAALVAAGIVHGYWTDRWVAPTDTTEAAELLNEIPLSVGDWQGELMEVKRNQVGAGVTGCIQRRYYNRATGQAVVIALVNGRPSFVAVHTPEVCYGASGYLVGEKKAVPINGGHFWTSVAVRQKAAEETRLRLYWAWNGGEEWVAARDARRYFPRFRNSILHKLYVLRDMSNLPTNVVNASAPSDGDEVCEAFLKEFVPVLNRTLFEKGS